MIDKGRVSFDGPTAEGLSHYLHQTVAIVGASISASRPGTREIRITSVEVPTQNVSVEEPKRIRFRIEQASPGLDRCVVDLIIRNSDGVTIAHCNSSAVDGWFSTADGPVDVECDLQSPWLHPGDYTIDIWLWNYAPIDQYDAACRLTVRPGYPYPSGITDDIALRDLVPPQSAFRALA